MAAYGRTVVVDAPFEEADRRTRAALAEQGFGVLTEIDVAAALQAQLDALAAVNDPGERPA